jgi:hypothetical protein
LRQKDETKINTLDDLINRSCPNFVSQYLAEVLKLTPVIYKPVSKYEAPLHPKPFYLNSIQNMRKKLHPIAHSPLEVKLKLNLKKAQRK